MISIAIHAIEAIAVGLVALVGVRILMLSKNKKRAIAIRSTSEASSIDDQGIMVEDEFPQAAVDEYQSRADALKKAQIFCGIQMIPIKREFTELNDPQLHWLREAMAYYLAGAAEFFAQQARCDTHTKRKFIGLVLSTNLRFDEQGIKRIEDLLKDAEIDSDEEKMFMAGSAAAKLWSETQQLTNVLKLRTRLNDWGVFA